MADTKISALTVATTPLAGTEVLPIVQSGVTKQVSVANLTAGRAISADSLTLTGSPLPATSGGTGQSSYAVGDLLYASTTTALSKLADVATGNALISGGVGVAPSWGKIGLATHVSGTLGTANGGTGLTSFTANAVVYSSSTSALATGSTFFFDGTNVGIGGVTQYGPNNYRLFVRDSSKYQITVLDTTSYAAGIGGAIALGGNYRATGDAQPFTRIAAEKENATNADYAYSLAFYTTANNASNYATKNLTMLSSGDTKLETGNLIQGTAAKGINFTANSAAAGKTSQLLNWYEEGTWTPAQGSGLAVVGAFSSTGYYTRIGRQVTVIGTLTGATSVSCASGAILTTNMPYASQGPLAQGNVTNAAGTVQSGITGNPTTAYIYSIEAIAATATIYFQMTYFV